MSQPGSSNQYVLIDDEMYEVQSINGKRVVGGVVQYLVKWRNWDRPQDRTWEPKENLGTVLDLIEKYQKTQGSANDKGKTIKSIIDMAPSVKKEAIMEKKQAKQKQKAQHKNKKQLQLGQISSRQHKTPSKQVPKKLKKPKKVSNHIQLSSSQQQQQSLSESPLSQNNSVNPKSIASRHHQRSVSPLPIPIPTQNSKLQIGNINRILVRENGQIFYEVDMINKNKQCIGVKLISNKEARSNYRDLLLKFLQSYQRDQEMWARSR